MSIIVIGDVHGCADQLEKLLKILPRGIQEYIFTGDVVNRGPDTQRVLDILCELRLSKKVTLIQGNHEEMLVDVLGGGEPGNFLRSGGIESIKSYINFSEKNILEKFIDNFPPAHARLLESMRVDTYRYGYSISHKFNPKVKGRQIYGHVPNSAVIDPTDTLINLDGGLGVLDNARLKAILLPSKKVFEV